ncbi:MAG TPA: biotin-dependent carboxyltransferase family protein [Saprospiraceae bacterium]|nr:biotin-dependent carboxyltransferase family protein [Saprospiraceae bacterium]
MPGRTTILRFLKPGMHTLIQDMGRPDQQSSGIPIGGALDKTSAAAANWCVGNPESSPVLEITMIGPQIQVDGDCQIAITGADMNPKLDGTGIQSYETIQVSSGSILSFGKLRNGCRAYLAVNGEWQVHRWLQSASALSIGNEDLVPGAVIKKGAVIVVKVHEPLPAVLVHPNPIKSWPDTHAVRVLPGPEFQSFTAQQIAYFFNAVFTISGESNRMGYRLEPGFLDYEAEDELISSGIVPGTIQITRQGQAVILMADAQTTGGYPRIANVLSEDLDALAQLKPGNTVSFKIVKG